MTSLFTLLIGGFLVGITVGMFWLMFYRKWQRYCEKRYGTGSQENNGNFLLDMMKKEDISPVSTEENNDQKSK
ncbi:MAG: hypothetical protein R3Y53_09370 [Bacillota bacterium]